MLKYKRCRKERPGRGGEVEKGKRICGMEKRAQGTNENRQRISSRRDIFMSQCTDVPVVKG